MGLTKIYPNTKAPSDHPPYMVHFTMELNAAIAERRRQEAEKAAEKSAEYKGHIHEDSECYEEDGFTLDCHCKKW